MLVLPAIDLRAGKVVRLAQGDYDRQTSYHDEPAGVARQFTQAGASWIHVVDLDAARSGELANLPALAAIRQAIGAGVHIEFGGGARDDQRVEQILQAGADRVVVGSAAIDDWPWFERLVHRDGMAGRIALGLDAREGMLAARGWTEQTQLNAVDVAARVRGWPLGAIVYTDIARDGMLGGVNVAQTARIIVASDLPVVASGGVSAMDDVIACRDAGCAGVIIGRAWYEGRIDLSEALKLADRSISESR